MGFSPLARLPPELRNRVYESALPHDTTIATFWLPNQNQFKPSSFPPLSGRPSPFALTLTSKQLRSESLQLFYAVNNFQVDFERDGQQILPGLQAFLERVGSANAVALTGLTIGIGLLKPSVYYRILFAVDTLASEEAVGFLHSLPLTVSATCVHGNRFTTIELKLRDLDNSLAAALEKV